MAVIRAKEIPTAIACAAAGATWPSATSMGGSIRWAMARLADPPEGQRGHRDPELAGGDVGIQVAYDVPRYLGRAIATGRELVQSRVSNGDDGELGRDKETIRQHQRRDGDKPEDRAKIHVSS